MEPIELSKKAEVDVTLDGGDLKRFRVGLFSRLHSYATDLP